MISIWRRYKGKTDKIDEASSAKEAAYLVGEYQMAVGHDSEVWAGRKDGQPRRPRNPALRWPTAPMLGYP